MSSFGWEVGLAFQIVDDCLDVVASQDELGKSVGTDVADGKVTLPVLHVYREADAATRAAIRDAYTRPDVEDRAALLRETCSLERGVEYALARARSLVESALERVRALPESPARGALEELGAFVLARRF